MSTITTSFVPNLASTTPAEQVIATSVYEAQHETLVSSQDNDDDISLANCMSRKLQLNQQMTTMYPCMPPNFMTLQQHQDLWKATDPLCTINTPTMNEYQHHHPVYGQNIPYAQYQQLQQQFMLQYQQQQLASMGYNALSRNSSHQQQFPGTNQRSSLRKSKSAPMDTHHDPKIRIPSSSTVSSFTSSTHHVRSSTHNSSSSSSLHSETTRKKGYQHHQHHHQRQQQRSSSPVPSLVEDSGTWRSSIYSHNSTASSSVKTASDSTSFTNTPTHSSTTSISSASTMSKTGNNTKRSLSKRLKGVFSSTNNSKQQPSSLRRSPSLISCASVMTTNTMSGGGGTSSRSSWTSLFRKSSKSVSAVPMDSTNQKETSAHVQDPKFVAALDSPASSISGGSYRHSSLRQDNGFITDLPSPAPSLSTTDSPSIRPGSKQQHHRHGNSNITSSRQQQQLRSSPSMDMTSQQDYFGLPSSRHLGRPYPGTNSVSFLQHGSPVLRPSANGRQSSNSSLVSEDDDISTCMMGAEATNLSSSPSSLSLSQGRKRRTEIASGKKNNARVQFTTTIQVHDTFGSQDYDRRCDTQVTCQRLTPVLALQIKKELNEYKLNDMIVHPSSRQYTQFFL